MTLAEPTSALQSSYGAAVATLLRGDRSPTPSWSPTPSATAGSQRHRVRPLDGRHAAPSSSCRCASATSRSGRSRWPAPSPAASPTTPPAILRRQAPPIALALGGALLAASATRSEDELEAALGSERRARSELAAQETVARIAAEGWPRDRAVAAAARAALDLLDVDATCLLGPRERGGLAAEAFEVAAPSLREPDPPRARARRDAGARRARRGLAEGRSLHLPDDAPEDAAALLGPLLGPGSTACLVPLLLIRGKLVAALAAVSLDPERPLDADRLERAERFAPALALALAVPGAHSWNHLSPAGLTHMPSSAAQSRIEHDACDPRSVHSAAVPRLWRRSSSAW